MIPYFGKSFFIHLFLDGMIFELLTNEVGKHCVFNCRFSRKSFCNIIQLIVVRPSTVIATSEEIYSCTETFVSSLRQWRDWLGRKG